MSLISYPLTNVIAQCHSECVGVEPDYQTKVIVKLPFQNEPAHLTVDVTNNIAYIEGDIILGDINDLQQQKDDILNGVAIDGNNYRWENAVIPYEIGSFSGAEIQKINDAAKYISNNTNLCVKPRVNEIDYIFVKPVNGGCSSYVGKIGGRQTINLSKNCSYGTVIHEFLHAAGLYHEQSRSDRDDHISVDFNNILDGKEHNFNKRIENATDYGPYNYASIMHYGAFAFAKNPQIPTITTIPPSIKIGQREELSEGDIVTINSIYPNPCGANSPDLEITSCGGGSISTQQIGLSEVTIKNNGDLTSKSTDLVLYFSKDGLFSEDDFLISTYQVTTILPGDSKSFTVNEDISKINPPLPEGTYQILLAVDVEDKIDESDETNNSCSTNTFTVSYGCKDSTAHNYSSSNTYADNSTCETCRDGIQNGGEQGIDCGRVCDNTCEEALSICASDKAVLTKLYNATNGSNWINKWDLTKPMNTWYGVKLNSEGCVRELNLFRNGLKGYIPNEIGNLSNLTYLRLSHNDLSGIIPISIGNLSKLRSLYLSNNNLSGVIPYEIANCIELSVLTLNDNSLTGSIPKVFSTLSNIFALSTYNNKLSGCFDRSLSILCHRLSYFYNSNERISNGNDFNITWEDLCVGKSCTSILSSSGYLTFDGVDDYVEVPKTPIEQLNQDFTFEAWIQGNESDQTQHPIIFSNRNSAAGGGFKFFFHGLWGGSQYKMLCIQLKSKNYQIINNGIYNGNILDGKCHHVAVSRKGDLLSYYVDGEFFGSRNIYTSEPILDINEPIWIGSEKATSNRFEGSIWDVRIWNKARTETEIKNTINQDIDGNTPNLISYWKLNEGEGQTIMDKTGLANGYLGSSEREEQYDPEWIDDINCFVGSRIDDTVSAIDLNRPIITLSQNSPNPAEKYTHIEYYMSGSVKQATLNIYDVMGSLVQSVNLQTEGKSILRLDVSDWKKGLYLYAIQSDADVIATKKMLIR